MRHGIGVPSFRGNPRSVLGGVFISENSNKIQILFESPAGEAAPAAAAARPGPPCRAPRGRRPCQHDKANALEAAGTARLTRQPGLEGLIQVPGRPQAQACRPGGRSACTRYLARSLLAMSR